MNIKEFFTGTEQEKKASEKVKKLKQKDRLRKSDQQKIQSLQKITRKHFIRLALSALLGLGVAGGIVAGQSDGEKKEAPAPVSKREKPPRKPLPTVSLAHPKNLNYATSPRQQRQTFDRGFKMIMEGVPQETDDPKLMRLNEIRKFRETVIAWAEVRGDQYISLETKPKVGAFLGLIPPNHPTANWHGPMVFVSDNPKINALNIMPKNITSEWAGIILTHELSHLYDRVYESYPTSPTRSEWLESEVKAYSLEIDAINHFSKGRFRQALLDQLKQYNIDSIDEFVFKIKPQKQIWNQIVAKLNSTITQNPPLSTDESGMRDALYSLALCFSIAELSEENYSAKMRAVETLIESEGGARFIPVKE